MASKPHRQNSDFQLRYFIAGAAKTPDGAYAALYAQKIDMESKVKHGESQEIDRKIKKLKAEKLLNSDDELSKLEGQKELLELESSEYIWVMNFQAAKDELATINRLMAELEPLRKYAHLSILEANEACQQEEWLLELKSRVENNLLSSGTIPVDQLETMRMHPDFQTHIVPHILEFTDAIGKLGLSLITQVESQLLLGK